MYTMYKDRHMGKFKRVIRHIKLISMNRRLFWMHWKCIRLIRVQSMYTMTPMYHMYKDRHMKKSKRVKRHIKLISMNRRLYWMHFFVHEVDQGAVYLHHDPHVPHVQGQAHREVQEGHEAHQIDQYEQEVVLGALRSA
jgi:hypothetical protein